MEWWTYAVIFVVLAIIAGSIMFFIYKKNSNIEKQKEVESNQKSHQFEDMVIKSIQDRSLFILLSFKEKLKNFNEIEVDRVSFSQIVDEWTKTWDELITQSEVKIASQVNPIIDNLINDIKKIKYTRPHLFFQKISDYKSILDDLNIDPNNI